jgi:hypothetical protein
MNMNNKNTTLSRPELMEMVWSKPTTRIAAEYGVPVTSVILACAHLNVPRPRAGHWSAVKFGTAPSRPPLPPIAAGQPQSTALAEWGRRNRKRVPRVTASAPPPAAEPPVVEKGPLHAVAAKTLAAYRGAETDRKYGLLNAKTAKPHLRLAVRPESLDRAVGLVSRLLTKLEQKGFTFVSDEKRPDHINTVFAATKTEVDWYVQELQERYQRELKPEEKDRSWIWDQWRYRPLGRLRIAIAEYHPIKGAAQSWGDGKNQKLDGKLDEIAEGFVVFTQGKHAADLASEQRRREWAEESRLREEREAWQKAEEKRRDVFKEAATQWEAAQELQAFREACEGTLRSKLPAGGELSLRATKWLAWADDVVNAMDPLRGNFLPRAVLEGQMRELSPAQLASLRASAHTIRVLFDDVVSWLVKAAAKDPSATIIELVEQITAVASYRSKVAGESEYYAWLRTPTAALEGRPPLEWLAQGHIQVVAKYVAPTVSGKLP